ncbi:MAG TPA: hypothetical protein VI790_01745 [Candidatus Nanoarchaeia archaeon]|nr:hypothetical protein [Candidatus Nanoarchaeia archaeon]
MANYGNLGTGLYNTNSASHVVYCAINASSDVFTIADTLEKLLPGIKEVSDLRTIGRAGVTLAKLAIGDKSAKFPDALRSQLFVDAKNFNVDYSHMININERPYFSEYKDSLINADNIFDVAANLNRLLSLDRDGIALSIQELTKNLPIQEGVNAESTIYFSSIIDECTAFLSSFDIDLLHSLKPSVEGYAPILGFSVPPRF